MTWEVCILVRGEWVPIPDADYRGIRRKDLSKQLESLYQNGTYRIRRVK